MIEIEKSEFSDPKLKKFKFLHFITIINILYIRDKETFTKNQKLIISKRFITADTLDFF